MIRIVNGEVFYMSVRRLQNPVNLNQIANHCRYRVKRLSDTLGVSSRQLEREFKAVLGVNPKWWLRQQRMLNARKLLLSGLSPKEIAAELGFINENNFAEEFKLFYGIGPRQMIQEERERRFGEM
jgi:AraC-like DNA-binding protein